MSPTPIADRFTAKVAGGRPLIGAGAGTGLSAKCAEAAAVDFIVIYNAGRYRMAGRGSMAGMMPYGNANDIVLEMADEILPVVAHTPVLAGICGTDPFRNIPRLLQTVKDLGFAGIQNFPTVCLLDGATRDDLEDTGYGFQKEVDMVALAGELGLVTATYVRTDEEAAAMADAGADVLVAHVGLTSAGMLGAKRAISLDEAARRAQRIAEVAHGRRADALVVCHGGPIATPADALHVFEQAPGVCGFLGASSMERIPAERALVETMSEFVNIPLARAATAG